MQNYRHRRTFDLAQLQSARCASRIRGKAGRRQPAVLQTMLGMDEDAIFDAAMNKTSSSKRHRDSGDGSRCVCTAALPPACPALT